MTFSYGRALQQSTLKAWAGKEANIGAAQKALLARAQANSEASLGKYVAGSQPSAGMKSYTLIRINSVINFFDIFYHFTISSSLYYHPSAYLFCLFYS